MAHVNGILENNWKWLLLNAMGPMLAAVGRIALRFDWTKNPLKRAAVIRLLPIGYLIIPRGFRIIFARICCFYLVEKEIGNRSNGTISRATAKGIIVTAENRELIKVAQSGELVQKTELIYHVEQ